MSANGTDGDRAERIRLRRPWEHSTGPRTAAGKRRMWASALRHNVGTCELTLGKRYADAIEMALGPLVGGRRCSAAG